MGVREEADESGSVKERFGEREVDGAGTLIGSDHSERVLHVPEIVVVARESPMTRIEMRERAWRVLLAGLCESLEDIE